MALEVFSIIRSESRVNTSVLAGISAVVFFAIVMVAFSGMLTTMDTPGRKILTGLIGTFIAGVGALGISATGRRQG